METLAKVLLVLVGVLHLWFLVMEMVLWSRPFGQKRFRLSPEKAAMTKDLAANQGLYNGFLAAGLLWAAFAPPHLAFPLRMFFTGCVLVAGLYGGLTTLRPILYLQALPGALALLASLLAGR